MRIRNGSYWIMSMLLSAATTSLTAQETAASQPAAVTNPSVAALLDPWTGPYGGIPPFDQVRVSAFEPAFEATMAQYRSEIESIVGEQAAPDFKNTIEALEKAGAAFQRVRTFYGVWSSTLSSPEFQAVERRMEPVLAAFRDEIYQNEPLFRRVAAVYETRESAELTSEQKRLCWFYHNEFVRAGAQLDASEKTRVAAINKRLAALFTQFSQNLLADEESRGTVLENANDSDGLPTAFRAAAAAQARAAGQEGKWLIANTRSSVEPFLTYATRRDLRERVWQAFVQRGDHKGDQDNKPIITEILKLRAERAGLLGFETHAHWRLENSMAGNPERAMELMEAVWQPAVARVREEVADMQALVDDAGDAFKIEPWDYRFYAEKVRKAKYDFDEAAVKPYLELNQLVQGMFWVAGELFGLQFFPVTDVPVYHNDVRVWEVRQGSEKTVGLFYFDPYARSGKRSGAWMSTYRSQDRLGQPTLPIVSNNCNFLKGADGEPVLLSWDEARTLLHEFGHGLHGLCSEVTYPSLSGTRVARDYVELPSQLLERWLATPEFLGKYARHFETGKRIPEELVQRIEKASTFNQGFQTTEFLASGLIDMKLHLAGNQTIDPAAFEKEELTRLGLPQEIVMRHRMPQFAHIFANDGYSAGYYSYLWADTLTADAAEAFVEGKGFYDTSVANRFREAILSRGNTVDPVDGYRQFRGRDAQIDALMRDRGFPVPSATR